jgi:initiation factor 1A
LWLVNLSETRTASTANQALKISLFFSFHYSQSLTERRRKEMPKNKGKGGKTRRRGKNENSGMKRELIFKDEGQVYAQVLRMLGNGRLEAFCFDGNKRLAHIRGKLQKKVWINAGDIILVGDFLLLL